MGKGRGIHASRNVKEMGAWASTIKRDRSEEGNRVFGRRDVTSFWTVQGPEGESDCKKKQ